MNPRNFFRMILIMVPLAAHAAATSTQAELFARIGDQQVWTLTLDVSSERCEARRTGRDAPATRVLSKDDCRTLSSLVAEAARDLPGHAGKTADILTDEPSYELRIGAVKAPVSLKAPETCEILDSGDLKCVEIKRTAAEKLVLQLRDIAQPL